MNLFSKNGILLIFLEPVATNNSEVFIAFITLLNYLIKNDETRTPDVLLGIQFAKVQLDDIVINWNKTNHRVNDIYNNGNYFEYNGNNVRDYYTQIGDITNYLEEYLDGGLCNKTNFNSGTNLINKIIGRNFWKGINRWTYPKYGQLSDKRFETDFDKDYLYSHIDDGEPTEVSSDHCLTEILSSDQYCSISKECLQIMDVKKESHGYHLTHKLLYYIFLLANQCSANLPPNNSVDIIISILCGQILSESRLIEQENYPNGYRDLLMEQVFLCGFIGYEEFLEAKWIQNILKWQNPTIGCFDFYQIRNKRATTVLSDNCSDHMSGLGLAVMSNYLRYGSIS